MFWRWGRQMAVSGLADPETIGEFIKGIPDLDLREAVARIHFSYTGENVLDE